MSDLRTAAQQALEALESEHPDIQLRAAIALRAALEQPEQEPVASQNTQEKCRIETVPAKGGLLSIHPPRREWRSLSGEEMHGLYRRAGLEAYYPRDGVVQYEYERKYDAYARAIEAALKEKNYE